MGALRATGVHQWGSQQASAVVAWPSRACMVLAGLEVRGVLASGHAKSRKAMGGAIRWIVSAAQRH